LYSLQSDLVLSDLVPQSKAITGLFIWHLSTIGTVTFFGNCY
jgi:hypothetical protein